MDVSLSLFFPLFHCLSIYLNFSRSLNMSHEILTAYFHSNMRFIKYLQDFSDVHVRKRNKNNRATFLFGIAVAFSMYTHTRTEKEKERDGTNLIIIQSAANEYLI